LGLKNVNIKAYRVITCQGMDIYDRLSRVISFIVTILIFTFGIINTIVADFINNYDVEKNSEN
jgi:hypothetical protein